MHFITESYNVDTEYHNIENSDIKIIEEYESEKNAGTLETRPIEELWKELDL